MGNGYVDVRRRHSGRCLDRLAKVLDFSAIQQAMVERNDEMGLP
jgi:hypothetical protein